jgi:hypothetical protein
MSLLAGLITEGEYKQKLEEDGREVFLKLAQDSTSFNEFMNKAFTHLQNISTSTFKTSGKISPSTRKSLRLIWDDYQKGYLDLEEKQDLNENVVGIGAINNPFPTREKSDYELAFEHYSKGEVNEENLEFDQFEEDEFNEEMEEETQPQSPVEWLVNNLDKYVMWTQEAKDLVAKALQREKNI